MFRTTICVAVQACHFVIKMLAGPINRKVLGKATRILLGWGGERKGSSDDKDLHNTTTIYLVTSNETLNSILGQ